VARKGEKLTWKYLVGCITVLKARTKTKIIEISHHLPLMYCRIENVEDVP
jgi:hypothetical protein